MRHTLVLLVLAAPALLRAQFQPPTPEELSMTADPKAPGASAVYLYREETTDDALHYHSIFERIKILSEKGKEQATIRVPYERGSFKVTDIKGRTIHADGTIIPLTTKPTDLMDFKSNSLQINQMVFTLPSVEVGSILEYRLEIRYDDNWVSSPTWEIQQPFYVHKAHYFFNPKGPDGRTISDSRGTPLNRIMWTGTGLRADQIVQDSRNRFFVDLTNIPPIPDDDWMPPLNTLKWRVEFYYTYAHSGTEFWDSEGKHWAKDAEHFTNPTGALKSAVSQIVAPADTDEQKARKIYAAVMKLENTHFARKKSQAERKAEKLKAIKDAEDVWKQQSGSEDEIALLYVALARAAGLKVWPMQVVDRSRAIFDGTYLSPNQLDDYIAIVQLNGKEVYLDPGQKMCPFGSLHWSHAIASGFRLSDKGAVLATTPASTYNDAIVQRVADLDVDEQGAVKGAARFVMTGPDALRWRQLALENDQDEVKKQFNESIQDDFPDGIQADFDHFLSLDDPETNLVAIVKVSGNLGTQTGKRFFLPGFFFNSRAKHPFVEQSTRETPVDVRYPKRESDDVSYHLPSGFTVDSAPKSDSTSWPDHAILKSGSETKGSTVRVLRIMVYNFTLVPPKDYQGLHDFYQKVAAADQQQLVLTRSTTAANGN
jgi:transglutaminase-like putative cysteine protease